MSAPLLDVRDLSVGYDGPPVLAGVTFAAQAGEQISVLGPNGGGKSTLFKALLGELEPSTGVVVAREAFGYVPQTERSRLDFPVSALDVALMGTLSRLPWWRRPSRTDRARAAEALEQVGLGEQARRRFGDLSGGQRQRVFLARALVQEAEILLLDEPFTGVDAPSETVIRGLLDELAAGGRAVLVATHDIDQARSSDRVLCLNRRQIAFGPPDSALSRAVLEATYGAEIVSLPGGAGGEAIMPPHHHDHGEGH